MMSNLATALPGVLWDTSMKGWHALILSCGMGRSLSTAAWTGTATSNGLSVTSAYQCTRRPSCETRGTDMELNPEAAPRLIPIPPPYDAANDPRFRDDGTFYLLRYRGRWYAGTAQKLWYGWNFDAVYDAGVQLSYGKFDAIYEIEGRATRPEPILEILSEACAAEGAGECD